MVSVSLIFLFGFLLNIFSLGDSQLAPGSNTYLPPTTNGYSYPEPKKPFTKTNPPGPPQQPGARPGPRPGPRPGGSPAPGGGNQPGDDHVHTPGMPYDFEYAVNDVATANDYSHKASSDGDVVNGEYRVALPDGRTQIVRYTADWKTGFHADVSYTGDSTSAQGPNRY